VSSEETKPEPRKRGPVHYLAFARYTNGAWVLAHDGEAKNIGDLKQEIVDRLGPNVQVVIGRRDEMHVSQHTRRVIEEEGWAEAELVVSDVGTAYLPLFEEEIAQRAAEREAEPMDPDDDEGPQPDVDPATGLSRKDPSVVNPEDEGTTVFPIADE
jgi:hypothetical protein